MHPAFDTMVSRLVGKMRLNEDCVSDPDTAAFIKSFAQFDSSLQHAVPLTAPADQRSAIFLSPTGIVEDINGVAKFEFNLMPGESLQKILLSPTRVSPQFFEDAASLIFLENRQQQPVVMVGVKEQASKRWLLVEADHTWPSGFAQRLIESYGLTKRECVVLQQICCGAIASDIAKNSSRKVGTIRQQIKSILVKLEINSQAQAVALITSILVTIVGMKPSQDHRIPALKQTHISSTNGNIGVCQFGMERGDPVLFFHGALFGICSNLDDHETAKIIGLNIVAPQRPGYGETLFGKNKHQILEQATNNALAAMDSKKIDRAVLLAHDIGTAYAFHFAHKHPERVLGIVCAPTTPPMHNWEQTNQMPVRHRVNAWAAQKLPQIMDGIVSLGLAHIGKNGIAVIPEYVFADSEFDRYTWQSPKFEASIRTSFSMVQQQYGSGFKFDMHLTNKDWSHLVKNINCPTILFHGTKNQTVSQDAVEQFCALLSNASVELIKDAGHTLALTHGREIFRAVSRLTILSQH